jgi:hypothetical protein
MTYRIQVLRQVVDAVAFLSGITTSKSATTEDTLFRAEAACLVVGSCVEEVLPEAWNPQLNVGLCLPGGGVFGGIPPNWKDTVLAIGTMTSLCLVVDFDFKNKFCIARATPAYRRCLSELPKVFVGTMQELRSKVLLITDAASNCYAEQGMSLPPWRTAKAILTLYHCCFDGVIHENVIQAKTLIAQVIDAVAVEKPVPKTTTNNCFCSSSHKNRSPRTGQNTQKSSCGIAHLAKAASLRGLLFTLHRQLFQRRQSTSSSCSKW